MAGLRQKTYTIFIRPYFTLNGEEVPYTQDSVYSVEVCQPCQAQCTSYTRLEGGQPWMKYNDPRNPTTSFRICKEIVRDLIQQKGYKQEHIYVSEKIPTDLIVTPNS